MNSIGFSPFKVVLREKKTEKSRKNAGSSVYVQLLSKSMIQFNHTDRNTIYLFIFIFKGNFILT